MLDTRPKTAADLTEAAVMFGMLLELLDAIDTSNGLDHSKPVENAKHWAGLGLSEITNEVMKLQAHSRIDKPICAAISGAKFVSDNAHLYQRG